MLESIINIGEVLTNEGNSKTIAELWIKDNKPMELLLVIDVSSDDFKLHHYVKEFDVENSYRDSLFYQQGNDLKKGSGVAIHNPKALSSPEQKDYSSTLKKVKKKLDNSLEFMELPLEIAPKILDVILDEISKNSNQRYFVMITKDNQTPYSLFRKKFEAQIKKCWKTDENLSKEVKNTTCHYCGSVGENYDTAIYNCYNNDKRTYSNIYYDIGKPVFGYSLCEKCISNLLNGRQYVYENMTTSWLGSNVMFLPHNFTKRVRNIYESNIEIHSNDNEYTTDRFLKGLYRSESSTLRRLEESDTITDIVFFKSENSYWGITYNIQGVLPSRFGRLGLVLSRYERLINPIGNTEYLYLRDILEFLCSTNSQKEKMSIVALLLNGKKFSREKFFSISVKKYKDTYFEYLKDGKHYLKTSQLSKTNKIYNILVECGCMDFKLNIIDEGDNRNMNEYKNQEEFFELNKEFFDSDCKKAWFILGRLYSCAVYESKKYYHKSKDEKSHLESNFLFSQPFNASTFKKISNKCKIQLNKYCKLQAYSSLFKEMRQYVGKFEYLSSLDSDEAQYIFFYGTEIFFTDNIKENKSKSKDSNNNNDFIASFSADILNNGELRADEESGLLEVSDFRLKRFFRDILNSMNENILTETTFDENDEENQLESDESEE